MPSYLTKITDQVIALISDEHSRKLVWLDDKDDDAIINMDEDGYDRMFTYEVSKTNEREENITMEKGVEVGVRSIFSNN